MLLGIIFAMTLPATIVCLKTGIDAFAEDRPAPFMWFMSGIGISSLIFIFAIIIS